MLQSKAHIDSNHSQLRIPDQDNYASEPSALLTSTMDISPADENKNIVDDLEHNSTSEAGSVASDLTRMCVSDEDDKISI